MNIEGLDLTITEGSLEEAFTLQKALSDALRDRGINFSLSGVKFDSNIMDAETGDMNVGSILEMVLSVATDKPVRDALYALGRRCAVTVDGKKIPIGHEFFSHGDNRKHYFPVMMEIARANLAPFFQGLNLSSLIPGGLMANFQK